MRTLQGSSPRRYYVDKKRRRVLIGLTAEETFEFEQLDRLDPLDGTHAAGNYGETETAIISQKERWLELYMKHDDGWKSWMAESKHQSF
jgi:hypothetical protein